MEGSVSALSSLITDISSVVTAVLGWMGNIVTFIKGEPLILIGIIAFFFVGGAIGLVKRLIKG